MSYRLAEREMWIARHGPDESSVWACHRGDLAKTGDWYRLRISNKKRSWSGTIDGVLYVVPFESHPGHMLRLGDAVMFAHDGHVSPDRGGPPRRVLVTLEELFAEDDD